MIDALNNKSNCCGCTACFSICPKNAISVNADDEGFLYPTVDMDKCVNCNLCDSVCAFSNRKNDNKFDVPTAYAAKHKSLAVLNESASGGMFTALSDYVLKQNGVVYGAAFDSDFNVVHCRADNYSDRDRMRGSKYVQSNTIGIFEQIESDLKSGKKVLFTGTPCQVDAVKAYLKRDYENLFCCDLICFGTSSPLLWKSYVEFLERIKCSKLIEYKFRPKNWGWYQHNQLSVFENGKQYHSCAKSNLYIELYYSRLIMRPSCHNCKYTNLNRPSDITIADCRGVDKVISDFGAYDGASLVLINSDKGKEIFDNIKSDLVFYSVNVNDLLQPPLKAPSKPNGKRALFFKTFRASGLKKAVLTVWGRFYFIKQAIKKILHKA